MNVFHKVTRQSLRKNKTRTVVTIIGIILSAAMISAVTTFTTSFMNYALENAIYMDGSWQGMTESVPYETYEELQGNKEVKEAVYFQQVGYAKLEQIQNEYKPYIYLLGSGDGAEKMLPIHITEGRYPAAANEILLPNHLINDGGVQQHIGDTITLDLGVRMLDGVEMGQNSPCYEYDHEKNEDVLLNETLEVRESRSYTVVGFYDRLSLRVEDYTAPGYTAFTVADETPVPGGDYDVYFQMYKPDRVFDFMMEQELSGTQNSDVLIFMGASRYDSFSRMLYSLAAIVIGLIMFGSVALVYNAFSISVSERTKQFGLLSSIGATKKQLRGMVFYEALTVSLVGIPLGLAAGVGGIGVTLLLIGDKFKSMGFDTELKLHVSILSLIVAALIALVTVFISAWIPSKRATRVSAVEAIRQNTDVKMKGGKKKTSKLTYRVFGLPGVLASKHYQRSKKKYRTTILSLFMSIVLFISSSAFCDYLTESVQGGYGSNGFDLTYHVMPEDEDKSLEEIQTFFLAEEHMQQVTYVNSGFNDGYISADSFREEARNSLSAASAGELEWMENPEEQHMFHMGMWVHFVEDEEFRTLLRRYHLNESKFMDPENPLAITLDGTVAFNSQEGKYQKMTFLNRDNVTMLCHEMRSYDDYHYGGEDTDGEQTFVLFYNDKNEDDVLRVPVEEAYVSYELHSGKTIYEAPYYIDNSMSGEILRLIYPISLKDAVYREKDTLDMHMNTEFFMVSDDHTASFHNLENTMAEQGLDFDGLYDYAAGVEDSRNTVTIIQVFSYGFIVLISLIAAANVFNTISTNISLRRREFAMLKSIGMSAKGFNRMMNYECLLYGTRALLYGLPVSIGVTYLIWKSMSQGFATDFHLPWTAILIAVLSVFIVVFATMVYAMGKIKKDNPIDALKNENL